MTSLQCVQTLIIIIIIIITFAVGFEICDTPFINILITVYEFQNLTKGGVQDKIFESFLTFLLLNCTLSISITMRAEKFIEMNGNVFANKVNLVGLNKNFDTKNAVRMFFLHLNFASFLVINKLSMTLKAYNNFFFKKKCKISTIYMIKLALITFSFWSQQWYFT